MLVTANSETLQYVFYIQYTVQFEKNQLKIQLLLNSGSEVNIMTPIFASKLGLPTQKTNIVAQKIDDLALPTYEMPIAGFSVYNKLGKVWFFEDTFLLANTSMKVILRMLFPPFSNEDIQFVVEKLI